jgi:hypothetical protein
MVALQDISRVAQREPAVLPVEPQGRAHQLAPEGRPDGRRAAHGTCPCARPGQAARLPAGTPPPGPPPDRRIIQHELAAPAWMTMPVTGPPADLRSRPVSPKSTAPLQSRLQPCPGRQAITRAASRPGTSAGGHTGACSHAAWTRSVQDTAPHEWRLLGDLAA